MLQSHLDLPEGSVHLLVVCFRHFRHGHSAYDAADDLFRGDLMQVDAVLSFCQRFGHLLHGFLCKCGCLPGIVGAGFLDVTDDLHKCLLDRVQFRYM